MQVTVDSSANEGGSPASVRGAKGTAADSPRARLRSSSSTAPTGVRHRCQVRARDATATDTELRQLAPQHRTVIHTALNHSTAHPGTQNKTR